MASGGTIQERTRSSARVVKKTVTFDPSPVNASMQRKRSSKVNTDKGRGNDNNAEVPLGQDNNAEVPLVNMLQKSPLHSVSTFTQTDNYMDNIMDLDNDLSQQSSGS